MTFRLPLPPISRRRALLGLGLSPLLPQAARAAVCGLSPQSVEGPFYFDPDLFRSDVTENQAGLPLDIAIQVLDDACAPLKGIRLDIWHANAIGQYSGYDRQGDDGRTSTGGQTFLRGTQATDNAGIATFRAVFPGWYRGRTTHIHVKALLDRRTMLTGQIYFPDGLNDLVYRSADPYRSRSARRDTTNETDGVLRMEKGGDTVMAAVTEDTGRFRAAVILAIDPEANVVAPSGPPGPPPGPRP